MTQEPKKLDTQLDAMLAEAKQAGDAAGGSPASQPAGGDEEQLVEQIDQMLASSAEEAVAGDIGPIAPIDTAAPAQQQTAETPPVEADDLQGEFQSVDDLTDGEPEPAAPDAASVAHSEATPAVEAFDEGSAEAVAEELDAVEQQGPADIEPSRESAEDAPYDPGIQYPREFRPPVMVRVLTAMNKPVMSWPAFRRDLLGYLGLESALFGFCLLAYVMLGATATMVAAVIGCLVLLVMFYLLFVRQPKVDAAEEPGLIIEEAPVIEEAEIHSAAAPKPTA